MDEQLAAICLKMDQILAAQEKHEEKLAGIESVLLLCAREIADTGNALLIVNQTLTLLSGADGGRASGDVMERNFNGGD